MTLQLDRYFFTSVEVSANPSYIPKKSEESVEVVIEGEASVRSDTQIFLNFSINVPEEPTSPYSINLFIFGAFSIDGDSFESYARQGLLDSALKGIKQSALGILYSASREVVLQLTSRQPWGPYTMPIIYPSSVELEIKLPDSLKALAAEASGVHTATKRKVAIRRKKPNR